jgi:hypothetical protein
MPTYEYRCAKGAGMAPPCETTGSCDMGAAMSGACCGGGACTH